MAITGDFVNGIHAMWRESTDDEPSSSSENTFLISMDNGVVKYWSGGEWKTADAMVCKMIAYLCGKGGDLPIVSASDNGKVLGVSNGAWGLVTGGSGGGMEKFTCKFSLSGSSIVCDKTFDEITAAKEADKYVEGVYNNNYCPLVLLTDSTARFQMLVQDSGATYYNVLDLTSLDVCIPGSAPIAPDIDDISEFGPAYTINAQANSQYICGEATAITITNVPLGDYTVEFTSGSTPTVLTIPSGGKKHGSLTPEANKDYELSFHNGKYILCDFEAVSSS